MIEGSGRLLAAYCGKGELHALFCNAFLQDIEVMKATEEDLRNRLAAAEKKLQDVLERQKVLEKESADWEDKYNTALKDLQKLGDELDNARANYEKVLSVATFASA